MLSILNFGAADEYVSAMSKMYIEKNLERSFATVEVETLDDLDEFRKKLIRELQEDVKIYLQEWRDDWRREHAASH